MSQSCHFCQMSNLLSIFLACVIIILIIFDETVIFPRCAENAVLEYQYKLAKQGIGKFELNNKDELIFLFTK